MIVNVEFDIITQVGIAVSFKVKNVDIKYNDVTLGNVSLSKHEFTTADTSYQTTITINITNSALYETLRDDFVENPSIILTATGNIDFLGV